MENLLDTGGTQPMNSAMCRQSNVAYGIISILWLISGFGLDVLKAAPVPAAEAVVAAAQEKLKWDPGAGAITYDVFFGTSRTQVASAQKPPGVNSSTWLGSTANTEIGAPQVYSPGGVWFWRVDAVTAATTIKGTVNYFSGQLALAGNLRGPNSYYGVDTQAAAIDGDAAMVGYPDWVSASSTPRPGQVAVFRRVAGQQQWAASQTLNKPSGSAADARFGTEILIRGRTAWISAPGDESVYKYQQDQVSGQWSYSGVRLQPPATLGGGKFGTSLAEGNGWLAVGVPETGNPSDDLRGKVDIFDPATGAWQVRLNAPPHSARTDRSFGGLMSGDGDTLAVLQSAFETQNVRVEIFTRAANGTWSVTAAISSPNTSSNLNFGHSLSLSGTVLLIGTPTRSSETAGRIYVFEQAVNRTWSQTSRFDPVVTGDGIYITKAAVKGNRAAVHFFRSGATSPLVELYQRESDATWARLGTTLQTAPADVATGPVSTIAISDGYVMQAGRPDSPTIRFYLHNTDANTAPLFSSAPVLFGEGERAYRYDVAATDGNAGDTVTLTAGTLPAWLTFVPGAAGTGTLAGTPPAGFTGDVSIALTATDSKSASTLQSFLLNIVVQGQLPVIASLSPDTTVDDHAPLELTVTLEGTGTATYQWFVNGILLARQTSARLFIEHAQSSDAGRYTVRMTRGLAVVESAAVQVTVNQVPDRFGGDWTTLGVTPSHSGRYPATLGSHVFVPKWTNAAPAANTVANQVAAAGGMAFISFSIDRTSAPTLRCLDLKTGAQVWTRSLPISTSLSPPSFHRGVIYLQRAKGGTDSPDILAFDAATGAPRWTANYQDQYAQPWAPAVSDSGVFTMGGEHGGIYRHSLTGSQAWFTTAPQRDEWTPVIHNDRVYVWTGGLFEEVSKADGLRLWTATMPWTEWEIYAVRTVPAAEGNLAAVLDKATVRTVDLDTHLVRMSRSGNFNGSPALADGLVYAITPGAVKVYRATDGTELPGYATLGTGGESRTGVHQPVVLDDLVLVSSANETWVFDRATRALKQRLAAGGPLTYADGLLMAAGSDGVVRAFAVNQSPVVTPPAQPLVWTEDVPGTEWTVPVSDADGDALTVSVVGAPVWMSVSGVANSVVTLSGTPMLSSQGGDFTLTLRISDGVSPVTERSIPFRVIAVNDMPGFEPPADVVVDEDTAVLPVNLRGIFSDEEDGAAGLQYTVETPPVGAFSQFTFETATGVLSVTLSPDFNGTVPLVFRARDSGALEAVAPFRLVVRPVADAPRVVPSPPAPVVPVDGSPVMVGVAALFSDPDAGDVMRYSIVANDSPALFSTAEIDPMTGGLRLVWAAYVWGAATLTLRSTDAGGLFADTALTVALPPPPEPRVTLAGATRTNRQTGLVEQTVVISNTGPRALGGFNLWVDAGPGAALHNGAAGETASAGAPAAWYLPYNIPLNAGAEITIVMEFYSATRTALPEVRGAVPVNGSVPEIIAGNSGGHFSVTRILPVPEGMLLEFLTVPGSLYQTEFSADGLSWKVSPIPVRAGGTAVQWIDRGPPFTPSRPSSESMRLYRVRKL